MKYKNPLLVTADMEKTKSFYRLVLGLRVVMDLGANITLTGGISFQTKDSWQVFIGEEDKEIVFGGNDAEVYFEEDDFDAFIARLQTIEGIDYVHPVKEHAWGQRVVRFYDPDMHIIEVGENMKAVCRRFIESGMSEDEAAKRMDVPIKYVKACMR